MRIVRIRISNFRCIKDAEIHPLKDSVLLGPNNVGKTAVLEALNLLLNPEIGAHSQAIDENDFYRRNYLPPKTEGVPPAVGGEAPTAETPSQAPATENGATDSSVSLDGLIEVPRIRIEAVLSGLDTSDEDYFRDNLVPWKPEAREVVEETFEGADPFSTAVTAIRVVFEGWYDQEEDDFVYATFFLPHKGLSLEDCHKFTRDHKRHIGFLIYRDFRGLTRPITLEPTNLFGRLLSSQEVVPKNFEEVLVGIQQKLEPMTNEPEFISLLNSYKSECERFLALSQNDPSALSFKLTDRTRSELKAISQLYVRDEIALPIQKMGAGTRSLALLAILTLIMRRRGRGILALEEPETFLFPHAQRRVIDECLALASQSFVTTHSPYVLERMPLEGVGRIVRDGEGRLSWTPLSSANVKAVNLYARRLRHSFCEALLGRGVVIVEGESDRWWINGASRILNRKVWKGNTIEALELNGIAVVSAETNGDVEKTARYFRDAGLKVACVVDWISDSGLIENLCGLPCPTIFLRQKGLEDVIAESLPLDLVKRVLTEAVFSKTTPLAASAVTAMTEKQLRDSVRDTLIDNKGSAGMHEWILSHLDEKSLPDRLGDIVDMVSRYMSGTVELGALSLIK
jgi:putative ATP-dependent endonuclease of OLD family